MVSNKTLATLLFITLNTNTVASTAPRGTKRPKLSSKSALARKRRPAPKPTTTTPVLKDMASNMNPVKVHEENTEMTNTLQGPSVPQVNDQFKALIEQREYEKIFVLGGKLKMKVKELLKQICLVVKTPDQYNGIVSHLKSRKMVAIFYVYGDSEIVKKAIIAESNVYDKEKYVRNGDLEAALLLALKEDLHDRVIEFFDVRKGITAERDEQCKLDGKETSFGWFVYGFIHHLAPWEKNGMEFRRFLILRWDELGSKHWDILDTLCQRLVSILNSTLHLPIAKMLFVDLVGQSSLLTSVIFANRFLNYAAGGDCSAFINCGWREAIQEGLKTKHHGGGEKLWLAMKSMNPTQFSGEFPNTEEARTAVCTYFPTKQQREEQWVKKNAAILYAMIKRESIPNILPSVLWSIIFEYAVLLIITWNLTTFTEWAFYHS